MLRKKANKKVMTKKVEGKSDNTVGDVTIDDFANTSRTRARFKKAAVNLSSGVKQEISMEEEGMALKIHNNLQGTTEMKRNIGKGHRRSKKAESVMSYKDEEEGGVDYPLDLWFIISEYISPESVGKFARICRSSYHVTTTGKFWFYLYKSYYRFVPDLPERLQPQCMVRQHGLRACVIRTLYYTYFALKREVLFTYPIYLSYLRQAEPHSLVRRQCCVMWHKKGKVRWYFFFKLKEISRTSKTSLTTKSKAKNKKTDFLEMIEDVAINPEDGCKILRVTCLKYSMLPPVIGLILQTVSMNLMPGFKEHRLQLGFGTSGISNTPTSQVVLNYVIDYQVLDWWHPCYPHQDAASIIELPQADSWD